MFGSGGARVSRAPADAHRCIGIVETVTPSDLERAAAIADTWQERELDIVDCTTFAIMERLGCPRAATFDSDFYIYRYGAQRSKAFEILR